MRTVNTVLRRLLELRIVLHTRNWRKASCSSGGRPYLVKTMLWKGQWQEVVLALLGFVTPYLVIWQSENFLLACLRFNFFISGKENIWHRMEMDLFSLKIVLHSVAFFLHTLNIALHCRAYCFVEGLQAAQEVRRGLYPVQTASFNMCCNHSCFVFMSDLLPNRTVYSSFLQQTCSKVMKILELFPILLLSVRTYFGF